MSRIAADSDAGPDGAALLVDKLERMLGMHQQALQEQLSMWTRRQESFMARLEGRVFQPAEELAGTPVGTPAGTPEYAPKLTPSCTLEAGDTPHITCSINPDSNSRRSTRIGHLRESEVTTGSSAHSSACSSAIDKRRIKWEPLATLDSKAVCIIKSVRFELFCAAAIVLNAVLIGVETEFEAYYMRPHSGLNFAQHCINAWFALELLLRIYAYGCREWSTSGKDRHWNMFDLLLVCLWPGDLYLSSLSSHNFVMTRIFRAFRLFRLVRTLRIFRVMRTVVALRKMVYALTASFSTLGWSLLLLLFEMYFFVVFFTQAATDFLRDPGAEHAAAEPLSSNFGSLEISLYTLYKTISNGASWGDFAGPLFATSPGWLYGGLFVLFTFVTYFGVLNVLTAVFVEAAMLGITYERDLLMDRKQRQQREYVKHIRNLFEEVDTDGSGTITFDEVEKLFQDPRGRDLLDAVEVSAVDAHLLFQLLDKDDSGSINLRQFCDGVLEIKGEARALDMKFLALQSKRLFTGWKQLEEQMDSSGVLAFRSGARGLETISQNPHRS